MAGLEAAMPGEHAGPIFVDDAGRRARIVRVAAAGAGVAVLGFIAMVAASLFGASWVPKLSLGVPVPTPNRVITRPLLSGPVAPAAPAGRVTTPAIAAAPAPAVAGRTSGTLPASAPVTTVPPATVSATPSTTAPGRSTASPASAAKGLTHKKAGTTTTTSVP